MILVVIVNFRTAGLTIDCLRSMEHERALRMAADGGEQEPLIVHLVEGCSGDDSADVLQNAIREHGWESWVQLILAPRNGGFAYANNVGIVAGFHRYPDLKAVWLVNPDTYLRPNALQPLWDVLMQRPDVGIVGSRLESPTGEPQCSGFRFPSIGAEMEEAARWRVISKFLAHKAIAPPISDQPVDVDWVAGASMLIRSEVFSSVGYLDDKYFMYFEETDFCLRALRAGWKTHYEPASHVVHLVGQSSGVTGDQNSKKRRPAYWFESRHRYFLTHFGALGTLFADCSWLFWRGCWHVRNWLRPFGRKPSGTPKLWWDFLRNSVLFKGFHIPRFEANQNSKSEQDLILATLAANLPSSSQSRQSLETESLV